MYRDRHRVVRWRFRKAGLPQSQTKLAFGTEAWWEWYRAAMTGAPKQVGAERTLPGTFHALVVAYYQSSDFKLLKASTRATYRGEAERFRSDHGDRRVSHLQAHHVRQMMDAMALKPAAANNRLRIIRLLMAFAVSRNWRTDDPTVGVKRLRYASEGFHTWSEEEIAQYETRWLVGTRERLALDLFLFTGQRSGDVRKMGRQHVRGGAVRVVQEKTGELVDIPLAAGLVASIAAHQNNNLTFLTTQFGEPFTAAGFGNWFTDSVRKAGLPVGLSAHGLRKSAARRLAEAGCTAHEIMSITGHRTLKEVERYTRAADQRTRAENAMAKLSGTKLEQKLSNPDDRLDKTGGK